MNSIISQNANISRRPASSASGAIGWGERQQVVPQSSGGFTTTKGQPWIFGHRYLRRSPQQPGQYRAHAQRRALGRQPDFYATSWCTPNVSEPSTNSLPFPNSRVITREERCTPALRSSPLPLCRALHCTGGKLSVPHLSRRAWTACSMHSSHHGGGYRFGDGAVLLVLTLIAGPIRNLAFRMGEVNGETCRPRRSRAGFGSSPSLNTPSTSWSSRLSSARLTREEQEKLSEAERKALESQMNPHFCSIR